MLISSEEVRPGHARLAPLSTAEFAQKAGKVEQQQEDALAVVLPRGLNGLRKQQPKILTEEHTAALRAQDLERGIRVKKPGPLINLRADGISLANITPETQWNVREEVKTCAVFDPQECPLHSEIS